MTPVRTFYGRVEIDLLQHRIDMDAMQYREWAIRSKCRLIQLTPTCTAKTVKRANPSPFSRAIRAEMTKLCEDLQKHLNYEIMFGPLPEERVSWWRRLAARFGLVFEDHRA